MKYAKTAVCLLSVLLVCPLVGCGPKQQVPVFTAQYYPDCYDPIDKLCKDQDNSSTIKSSVIGGAVGGVLGAGVGFLASGDVKGAVVGGLVGVAGGATVGFFHSHLSKIADRNQRLAEYRSLLGETSKNWDLERVSVEKAYRCYREQIALLTKQVKAKKISKDEFLARMHEIEAGIENINTYWADAQTRIDEKIASGHAFLKEEEEKERAAVQNENAKRSKALTSVSKMTANREKAIAKGKEKTNKEKELTISSMDAMKLLATGNQMA